MNYMKQIADMFGVRIGEEFNIDGCDMPYKIMEDGIKSFCWGEWSDDGNYIIDALEGKRKIIKKPFMPNEEEQYYFVDTQGYSHSEHYIHRCCNDEYNVRLGNCYRTKEDADKDKEKWIKFFASKERINWENAE